MDMKTGISRFLIVLAVLFSAGTAFANIDVNVVAPNVPIYISSTIYSTYDINFLVMDKNMAPLDANFAIYLSTGTDVQTDQNHLIADMNLLKAGTNFACVAYQGGTDYNFYDANQMCRYRWTPTQADFPDGNWLVDVNVWVKKSIFNNVVVNDFNKDRDWSDSNFTLDSTAPSCTITSPAASPTSLSVPTITLGFSATDANSGDIMEYYVNMDSEAYASNGTTTTKTWSFGGLMPVTHTFYVKARDHADNNCTAASAIITFEAAPNSRIACGDGVCSAEESAGTCAVDCPSVCGDGVCTGTESTLNCPMDCTTGCGNKKCEAGETCSSCASDCGSCPAEVTPPEGVTPSEGTPSEQWPADPCAEINCNDGNPCTADKCYNGECSSVAVPNGTTCGYGKECRSGACAAVSAANAGEGAGIAGLDLTTLSLIVVVVVVLGALYLLTVKR